MALGENMLFIFEKILKKAPFCRFLDRRYFIWILRGFKVIVIKNDNIFYSKIDLGRFLTTSL